ncbi:MAG: ribonuclease H-like domain-containing protein [bacterium]
MRETDRDIRDRIAALKLALREGAPDRRSRGGSRCPGRGRGQGGDGFRAAPDDAPLAVGDIDGAREVECDLGRCLLIERDVGGLVDPGDLREAVSRLAKCDSGPRYVFLDLETTGFSSTPLFLAGAMFEKDGVLACAQLLARDYSEERALVGMLDRLIEGFDICVTFNGKSFDIPYLRERAKYHRLDLAFDPEHLDILYHARRMWRDSLPNCRLTTLERHILGRRRSGDVPGWEVPCIYHDFVHTDDARRLVGVIRHNLMDVVSMAELLICLAEA